jgi:sugar phosphate isomerase/epimerase
MHIIDRRSLISGIGMTTLVAATGGIAQAKDRRTFFERTGLPVGLQIYTLGGDVGKDLDATFTQVAKIGYREIELPSLFGRQPADIAAAAARAGLSISSIHLPLMAMGGPADLTLVSEPTKIADALGQLGAKWAVAPIMLLPADFRPKAGESFGISIARSVAAAGEDIWKRSAAILNERAAALKPLGIQVGYHNHNLEFAPVAKTTGWDILWRETQPGLVHFEVDLGWVATAGLDPVQFLNQTRGRVRLVHVKDVAKGNPQSYTISMTPTEVGAGTLDWARILPAAHRAGVRHFYVEQEPPFTIPRIDAAAQSYAFLSKLRG